MPSASEERGPIRRRRREEALRRGPVTWSLRREAAGTVVARRPSREGVGEPPEARPRAKPRVLLADPHALLLEGLRRLLESEFEIVGCVTRGERLAEEARRLLPDVIVAEAAMPGLAGLEAIRRVRRESPSTRVVLLTAHEDASLAADSFRLGVQGWVPKSSTLDELHAAVRGALRGRRYLTPRIAGGDVDALLADEARGPADALSPRERQVLKLTAEGKLMKQAAAALGISARTVAFHKYRAMEKLGVRSNAELVQYAVRSCIV